MSDANKKANNLKGFQKNYIPWNKGIKTGIIPSSAFKKGSKPYNTGKTFSGNSGHKHTEEWKARMSKIMNGREVPKLKGENHPRWIKDRSKLCKISKQGERRTTAYFYWRKEVWSRDGWKCRMDDKNCNGRIEAHHILGFTDYPDLRYKVNNGITLCHFHHPRKKSEEKRLSPYFQDLISNKL